MRKKLVFYVFKTSYFFRETNARKKLVLYVLKTSYFSREIKAALTNRDLARESLIEIGTKLKWLIGSKIAAMIATASPLPPAFLLHQNWTWSYFSDT